MDWKLAEAKQHLSEVVRRAADEPQILFNRDRPVAAVIAAEGLPDYLEWRSSRRSHSFADAVDRLVEVCREERYELEVPERVDRVAPSEWASETPVRYRTNRKKGRRASPRHKRRQ